MDTKQSGRINWDTLYELEKAQTEAATAQAWKWRAEALQAESLTKEQKVKLEHSELDLSVVKMKKDEVKYSHDVEMAQDKHHYSYLYNAAVDINTATHCMRQLTVWDRLKPDCPIEIVFTSPGGDMVLGLGLYDFMRSLSRKGHHITTKAYGLAASMAAILLQAGDTRKMGREAWLLMHEASFGAQGKTSHVKDTLEFMGKANQRLIAILCEKSNLTVDEATLYYDRKEWWVDSEEALKLGLVDEIE